jgi:hypothetical protein
MDTLRALNAVTVGTSGPAAALPQVQADTLAVIAEIAASERLTASERSALTKVAVDIDQFINAQPIRAANLAQVAGLGMYLRQTSATTIPRWNVMTALRTYGLNLGPEVARPSNAEVAAQQAQAQLEQVARSSRNVSLETALAVAARTAASMPVAQQPVAPAPKPAPVAESTDTDAAPARVEKIV